MHSTGFAPVATAEARILILGSLPGPVSLQQRQYYAQPRNAFWPIMGELYGATPDLEYPRRLAQLKASRVALWDVCKSAVRRGALDADIRRESIVANDFAGFFRRHRKIQAVYFNGQTAAALYRRMVLAKLPDALQQLPTEVLPSTSPAHAAMRFLQKLERWRIVQQRAVET
jgi:TDG/mug DNA glycosylase family protein